MTKAHSFDLTRNQTLVLEALVEAKRPLRAYNLLGRLREAGLRGPPQIYRALEKLVGYGLVHRLESVNAFVACADDHGQGNAGPVAFAICDRCESVREFANAAVAGQLSGWSRDNAFQVRRTTVELRGICSACSERSGADGERAVLSGAVPICSG